MEEFSFLALSVIPDKNFLLWGVKSLKIKKKKVIQQKRIPGNLIDPWNKTMMVFTNLQMRAKTNTHASPIHINTQCENALIHICVTEQTDIQRHIVYKHAECTLTQSTYRHTHKQVHTPGMKLQAKAESFPWRPSRFEARETTAAPSHQFLLVWEGFSCYFFPPLSPFQIKVFSKIMLNWLKCPYYHLMMLG